MSHDLIVALLFIAIAMAPAIVTVPEREEKDSL